MKILFVCSGNTCRSPMAEAMFRQKAAEKSIEAQCQSAGISAYTGSPASDNSVKALKEIGIDLGSFRSRAITSVLPVIDDYDLFVPMTYSHALALISMGVKKNKIYLFDKDVSDPYGGGIDVYRATRDELSQKLDTLADFIINMKSK